MALTSAATDEQHPQSAEQASCYDFARVDTSKSSCTLPSPSEHPSFANQLRASPAMTSPPPTLLTLPVELRSNIFHLALLTTPVVRNPDPPYRRSLDLSLLSTNRQIYYETRAIPLSLYHLGKPYDPEVNFLTSLSLRSFQLAALRTLVIEYLDPSDLKHFLALGNDNGCLLGEKMLNLDLLVIYADDWIGSGARRWRYAVSPEDVHNSLPRSSRWLRALCGLKGWKQLEVAFKAREIDDEYWARGGFIQPLFDDFRSHSGDLDEDFTIWHASHGDRSNEKITVLRTRELGRFKQPQWWKQDLKTLMEGRECVLDGSIEITAKEEVKPALHVQERCWGPPRLRQNHCTRCQPDCKRQVHSFCYREEAE